MTSFCLATAYFWAFLFSRNKTEIYRLDMSLFVFTGLIDVWIVYIIVNSKLILALAGGS